MNFKVNHKQTSIAVIVLLLLGTITLCWSSILWIAAAFAGMHDQFNLILLVLLLLVIANQFKQINYTISNHFTRRLNPIAVLLYIAALGAYYFCRTAIDINLLSAFCFGILLFGLLGFYLHSNTWHRLAVPSFLILLTLPFGNLMDTYLGFPLRIFAADLVHQMLQSMGYDSINMETIITLENQSTQINMNCSGMKGLWASFIYFFTLSWIYKVRVGIKWFAALLFSTVLVLLFNLMRIMALVILELVADQKEIADNIHTPLGLAGFVLSCLISWSIIYYVLRNKQSISQAHQSGTSNQQQPLSLKRNINFQQFIIPTLLLALLLLIIDNPVPKITREPFAQPQMIFPSNVRLTDVPLTEAETFFFAKDNCFPVKKQFEYKGLKGTFLCVFNASFRGHHHPEACMQGAGFDIGDASTLLIDQNFPVKKISLNDDTLTATYWFQAPFQITEDYSSRVWLELLGKREKWVMVSILFNQQVVSDNEDYQEFLRILSNQINNNIINLTPQYETS